MSFVSRCLALVLVCCAAACADTRSAKQTPTLRGDVSKVTLNPAEANAIVSAYRSGNGLSTVRLDPKLNAMAQVQADAMARKGVLSHDAAGPFRRRLDDAGIETTTAAENIGAGYFSLDAAMRGWKTSPSHDKNLLKQGVTRFGIALAKSPGRGYQTYWAMVVAGEPPPPDQVATLSTGPIVVRRASAPAADAPGSILPFAGLFSR